MASAARWYLYRMATNTKGRAARSRKRQYTQQELADLIGVSRYTVMRLERSFLTPLQRAYLKASGYGIGLYPNRNGTALERIEGQTP